MKKPRKPRETTVRFGVSLPASLLDELDTMVARRGFGSRSQALAALCRDGLADYHAEDDERSMAGTITLVYDHRKPNLQRELMEIQHRHYLYVVSSLHVHLENHNYLEVLLVQGPTAKLRLLADELLTSKGVRQGKLQLTATAMPPLA